MNEEQQMFVDNWSDITKVINILGSWHRAGCTALLCKTSSGTLEWLPAHPEFLYRREGTWNGWEDFAGGKREKHDDRDFAMVDRLEGIAWAVAKSSHKLTGLDIDRLENPPSKSCAFDAKTKGTLS